MIPPGVTRLTEMVIPLLKEFTITRNQTELLDYTISNLKQNLSLGFCIPLDINMFLVCGLCAVVSMLVGVQMFRRTQDRFVLHI